MNVLIFVLRFDTAANVGTCLCRGVLVANGLYANSRITSFQKAQSLQALKTFPKANNILLQGEILVPWHSSKVLNHVYRRICNLGNVQCDISCLCLKIPREFLRAKPLLWVEKITKYRWFYTLSAAKNWKKFQSGIGYKCTSYSSVKSTKCPAQGQYSAPDSARERGRNGVELRLLHPEKALLWMWP